MPIDSMKLIVKGRPLTTKHEELIEPRFRGAMGTKIRTRVNLESSRGAGEIELEASPGDVLEVSLEDGLVLYTTVERFEAEFMPGQASRGGSGKLVIPQQLAVRPTSRGLFSFILKTVGLVDVKTPAGPIADFIKDKIESKIVGTRDALYTVEALQKVETVSESNLKPHPEGAFNSSNPILLFIHGTASSTQGSFVSPINSRAKDNPEKRCNKSKKTLDKVFGQKPCFQCSFVPLSVSSCLSIREATGTSFAMRC